MGTGGGGATGYERSLVTWEVVGQAQGKVRYRAKSPLHHGTRSTHAVKLGRALAEAIESPWQHWRVAARIATDFPHGLAFSPYHDAGTPHDSPHRPPPLRGHQGN